MPSVYFSPGLITAATLIHTFATIFFLLGVLAHLAALVLKVNRPMVKPIFTGKMDLAYVQRRHSLWYEKLTPRAPEAGVDDSATPASGAAIPISPGSKRNAFCGGNTRR